MLYYKSAHESEQKMEKPHGAVVKLEFTPVCHTGGRGFESRQLRHSFTRSTAKSKLANMPV